MCDRIVVLVDMDCFYCQVETRYNPSLKGKPMAVVQYNQWQGGGIIAVNYEARAFGVTRHIRGNEAKKLCPEINLVHVPSVRGKADLTRYREAGREVVDVLCQFSDTVQRASVDEAYLDITQAVSSRQKTLGNSLIKPEQLLNTFVVGCCPEDSNDEDERKKGLVSWLNSVYQSELRDETVEKLAVAAWIVEDMRAAVYQATGFRCSAGIAHNKILAKLACGLHKPQRQTLLQQSCVPILYRSLPLRKVRGLGGKFGDLVVKRLNVTVMGELQQFSEAQLQKAFDDKSGSWLYNIARGIDEEAVTSRLTSKSIGCCKKFPGKLALATREVVEHWLGELSEEVAERLEKELVEGGRKATQFVVSYMQTIDGRDVSSSRCGPLTSFEPKQILIDAMEYLKRSNTAPATNTAWFPPLKFLGLSAGKFVERDGKSTTIQNYFKAAPKMDDSSLLENEKNTLHPLTPKVCEHPITPENPNKEEKINSVPSSSGKHSFLVKFFKQEGLIKTPTVDRFHSISVENKNKMETKSNVKITCRPTGTSQQPTTSEGYTGISNKALRLMQVDESSNDSSDNVVEHWVSPREIFPNLDEVDDNVAALLPSPLQRELHTRLQKHREAKSAEKNKGLGKGKSRKCLTYDVEDDAVADIDDKVELNERVLSDLQGHSDDKTPGISDSKEKYSVIQEEVQGNMSQQDIFASDSMPEQEKNINSSSDSKSTNLETLVVRTGKNKKSDIFSEKENNESAKHNGKCNIPGEVAEHSPGLESELDNQLKDVMNVEETLREVCPHCNQLIPLQEYPEHLDFHVASKLDQELNRVPVPVQNSSRVTNTIASANSPKKDPASKRKRGKPGQRQPPPATDKKMRSITTFFAPVR